MEAPRPRHFGLVAVAVASVSFSAILVRYAAEEAPPLVIGFWRLFLTTLMLAPAAIVLARREQVPFTWTDMATFAGIGFLLAAHFATWITSLALTSVAAAAVLVATESLWVPLGQSYLLKERVGPRVWAGVLVALAGSAVLILGDRADSRVSPQPLLGDFLALAGAIAASFYFLASRRVRQRVGLYVYATLVYAWATLFLLAFVVVHHEPIRGYSWRTFAFFLALAFFPQILGHTLINYLLKWVPPHYISTSILAEPVVSALLAWALLAEALLPLVALGGVIILAGILVATTGPPERATVAPLESD